MKIVIENGAPTVQLTAGEERSLLTARDLCHELGRWLGNEDAKAAAPRLACLCVTLELASAFEERSLAAAEEKETASVQ